MKKSRFGSNLIFSIINVLVSTIQSLWLVPFITRHISIEAYGYMTVVVNIVNISTVMSLAITAMSARFITIELQKKHIKRANEYFNSVLVALIGISMVVALIFLGVVSHVNLFMNISTPYVNQVKILFVFSVGSLIIAFINTPFISGLYYTNKLYVMYVFSILNYVARIVFSFLIFFNNKPVIWGAYFGGFIVDLVSMFYYFCFYKKQIPGIMINLKYSKLKYIYDVAKSGIWISISKLGSILISTINSYLSNILINVVITGIYSSIIQLQSLIILMTNAIVTCFVPKMYKLYANDNKKDLIKYVRKAIRIISIPLGILIGGITVFGKSFMVIWLGKTFANYEVLIILSVFYLAFILPVELLNQLLITLNKLKMPAIISILAGICNVFIILLLCKVFHMGIYGIAISQSIVLTVRALVFFPIYTSDCMQIKRKIFYAPLLYCPYITGITIGAGVVFNKILKPNNLFQLTLDAIFTTITVFCVIIIFDKKMRNTIKKRTYHLCKKGKLNYE